jgi:hypothetical protein
MRRSSLLMPLLALAACDVPFVGPDCIDETRSLSVSTQLTVAGPGIAGFSLSESRNHRSKRTSRRDVTWSVRSGVPRSTVTAIHVHESGTGHLLVDVPIDTASGPPPVITQVFQGQPYAGPTDWDTLYQTLGEGRAFVDVHTTTRPEGLFGGGLEPESPDWQGFSRAYCS